MAKIIGVRFRNAGKSYYFDPNGQDIPAGAGVIVETAQGVEYGDVTIATKEVPDAQIVVPLKSILRVATEDDKKKLQDNQSKEAAALEAAEKKALLAHLDMKFVRVEYTFDCAKAVFYFTSDGRVDFRDLVKELASTFHTRIELRQIGVRDEVKMLGGLGPCGQPCCCNRFLGGFQPVSIKMAKEQGLSLNPTKISGLCGRLMCCLKYEESHYELAHKKMPRVGSEVTTADGQGRVQDVNVFKETVKVTVQVGDQIEMHEYPYTEVQVLRPGKKIEDAGDESDGIPPEQAEPVEQAGQAEPHERHDRPKRPERPAKPFRKAEVQPAPEEEKALQPVTLPGEQIKPKHPSAPQRPQRHEGAEGNGEGKQEGKKGNFHKKRFYKKPHNNNNNSGKPEGDKQ